MEFAKFPNFPTFSSGQAGFMPGWSKKNSPSSTV